VHPSGHEPIRFQVKRQRGASLLLFVVGLLLLAATVFAIRLLGPAKRGALQAEVTAENIAAVQSAILAYVAVNGHIPCPANPAPANDGQSAPLPPSTSCTSPNGVVPWATLGIAPDVALDGWNRRISFRVLDGATGLTQAGGASMVNCDTLYPYGGSLPALPANGLCPLSHANTEEQFLNGKGLVVSSSGTLVAGVAYVLISHGESGYGAYLPGGQRMPMPPAGDELTNTNAASPLYKKAHSDPGTDPSSAAHFDDIVAWGTISDLAKRSGLGGRDWQDSGATVQISPATTTNMLTAGAGHLNAAGTVPVTTADTIPDAGNSVDTLAFVGGGAGAGAACIWWPTSFMVYNSATTSKFALRLYLEFSTTNASTDFGGFTVGFLSKSATDATGIPFTALCGDTTTSSSIGWDNGASVGNLPTPRFAVELDTSRDSSVNKDPSSNHLAIDFSGVEHGTSATSCAMSSDSYHVTGSANDCYTGPSNAWLRDGLSNFHRMRVEIFPRDPSCSAGAAPRIKVWVIPQSVCPSDSADAICTSARNLLQLFSPTTPLPAGVVAIESCIPMPPTSTAFDQLFFGFTASSLAGASGQLLNIRNLGAAAFLTP